MSPSVTVRSAPPRSAGRRLARPKSTTLTCPSSGEQDVGRLDVAVDQPDPVSRLQRVGDLGADFDELDKLERLSTQPRVQRLALDVLHDEKRRRVGLLDRVYRDDMRMVERGGELGLAHETFDRRRIAGRPGGQELDGDGPLEP